MKTPKPVCIDFETFGIAQRPAYPPLPVGVSIKYSGKKPTYYGFGHPVDNTCSWDQAYVELQRAWNHPDGILCQNAKFDVDVATTHFGLPMPEWDHIHDTMFLLFLDDPHQVELSLKPSAVRLLGMDPEEQDAVGDWLLQHQPVPGVKISKSKQSPHYFGRYIAFAPAGLVGKYANGDVIRTEELFKMLWPKTVERKMLGAYDTERRLMPVLLGMERQGLPVDMRRLSDDVITYNLWHARLTAWLHKQLGSTGEVNLDSGPQLVTALIDAGKVDVDKLPLTPTGKYQSNKEALLGAVTDRTILAVLKYRTQLGTCLRTFMEPWLSTATKSNGLIFTTWNQTKAPSGDSSVGTRTGRLSSTPNFQNIPKVFSPIFLHEAPVLKHLPRSPFKDLPPLPRVRSYVVPFKGHVLIDRDYSQQEPRILAHFDGGALMETYQADPWVDFHDYAKAELEKMGKFYARGPVKNTNLGLIYGMGVGKLAERNNMSVEEANELKKAILTLYPGLKAMYQDMRFRARSGLPIRTWGGREYYCEPPKLINGRMREFDYKLVNVLIQGSAADCTKEALIRFDFDRKPEWKIILNVHDEIVVSVPKQDMVSAMEVLKHSMESVEFDVPIFSEGSVSTKNWSALEAYDKKGSVIYGSKNN